MAEQPGRGPEQQQSSEAVQELADREDEGLSIASREEGKKTSKPSLNDIDEGVHAPKTSIKKRGREEDTESSSEEGEVKSSQPEPKPAAGGKPKAAKASSNRMFRVCRSLSVTLRGAKILSIELTKMREILNAWPYYDQMKFI